MFENLTEKFDRAFKVLKGQGQITEINVAETLKEVRRALLDADVSFKTAKDFTEKVKETALGQNVLTLKDQITLLIIGIMVGHFTGEVLVTSTCRGTLVSY